MRKIKLVILGIVSMALLSGCNLAQKEFGEVENTFKGREAVIQTYDEESNIIDQVRGKSISVTSEDKFATKDTEGNITQESSVISLTVGGKSMVHVGSSLIVYEKGLVDIFNEYSKTVDVKNTDRSIPFLNRMINDMKNITTGKSKIVLIRSQSGKPLATFAGENVSYFATEIDKSTGIIIDGKHLFVYRCDYTIYDAELLGN
ncbi:ATPase (PilT family), putative (plasmid) [Peptoclostridium acidaminophilum DSM 3953]|uniref:ATPase (PilT family), putative n=1 Tax=Peptoclostridium acidaminophilum DSM 3953 TaxID=1286171 RepID=W8T9G3_PEPAC|nr:DUF5052 family protein [Peptoclostridium acidaminophilum]AHM57560.1 ATPase (PilT family), putative [Peptoclostridium acidaminophilum DSM 3953]